MEIGGLFAKVLNQAALTSSLASQIAHGADFVPKISATRASITVESFHGLSGFEEIPKGSYEN